MTSKLHSIIFSIAITSLSCSVKPEPLQFGEDACYTCKMTLVDKKFGAEIVTKKGKVYKFDDLNCLINFKHSGYEPEDNIETELVVDFAHPEKLISAKPALYCQSPLVKSPMASHTAAFENKADFDKHNEAWSGVAVRWDELATQFK